LASSSTIDHTKKTVTIGSIEVQPLPGATFGGLGRFHGASDARAVVAAAKAHPAALPNALDENRTLIHAATWFDAAKHQRLMWRTTLMGNSGAAYAGEKKSWIPEPDAQPIAG
jgi:hypothetical protein